MKNDSDWIMSLVQSFGPTIWYSETPLIGSPMGKKKMAVLPGQRSEKYIAWDAFALLKLFSLINSRNVLHIAYSNCEN